MHDSVIVWVAQKVIALDLDHGRVLEVGSQNINGSVRPLFGHTDYLGVDVVTGPGVDMVVRPGELPLGPFDTAVSTEMLEHDLRPWRTIYAMARVLGPKGHLLLTARGFDHNRGPYPFHHPPDRWRFSAEALKVMVEDAGLRVLEVVPDSGAPGFFLAAAR